ncbi:DNA invertase Pin-like site-specific DNA recombinase [Bradyrhizobium elkanii]|nr:DNA invertase Pin-like site-specific DNA recombinase [Bradyrhizobium elkanii]MCS3566899.1 DNA invertase Pin-like site-specific DNA recombinase [Bradyrhizobium elkanii]MCW2153799.1 DNA invertase Pin-like site-specific DNA recombinase [Bradyrhizobium elkanii]MCW2380370.1 DNA invertase Pin-like site-specific DNA recombinase [Bradyrhizobium elkanii]
MRQGTATTSCCLGLKGSLNEYELDLLRQRSLSARYEKARRGELVVTAPVGFVKAGGGRQTGPFLARVCAA